MSFERLFESLRDLPVAQIADDVTLSVLEGKVTTLSSATGSGKTLYQTSRLADVLDEQVVVLVPRRFLAVNAAETVAELAGCEVGGLVGYAVGSQTGDRSCVSKETKLVFATSGYAIASGLVFQATTFVLDEVHETTMDLSIIRAVLRRRIKNGEHIRILEMSATLDTKRQSSYWAEVAETNIFEVDGKTFPCEVRHRPAGNVAEEVLELVREGRTGILVFRPGVGEVEETAEKIADLAASLGLSIEVAQIYGELSYEERRLATTAPVEGSVKVLIGTNVVESGANIPWLDAGVSCGTGKENCVRPETGATFLQLINLPRWRLQQQEGRVKRFRPGIFVLCSPIPFGEREQASRPEIERLAMTELVMHCAGFGIRSHELTFDYAPDPRKIEEAELKLQRLGLIDEACQLTEAGAWVSELPVGPETGAMLWYAKQRNCLGWMLPLAAVIEVGGIRKDFRLSHCCDNDSDYLDGLLAFRDVFRSSGKHRRSLLEEINVGYKRFEAASDLLFDLERRVKVACNWGVEQKLPILRQCLLAGSLDKLFISQGLRSSVVSVKEQFNSYQIGQGSVVQYCPPRMVVGGDLRVITPKDRRKPPFTILERVSRFSLDDLHEVAKLRPEILVTKQETDFGIVVLRTKLFGEYLIQQSIVGESRNSYDDMYSRRSLYGYSRKVTEEGPCDPPLLLLVENFAAADILFVYYGDMQQLTTQYHRAFKDADIRGIYPSEIDEEAVYFIARAFVDELACKKVVVGRDMRLSSPTLHSALLRGVTDAGAEVIDIGLVDTPQVYFASGKLKLSGVMITASHSPRQYNGLKFVYAGAIPLTEKHGLAQIRKRVDKGIFNEPKKRGVVTKKNLREEYQKYILRSVKPARYEGIRLAVDIGNGMAAALMPLLEEKLPIHCDSLFTTLDGTFPHRGSDPTLLKNQIALRRQLKALPYDFGVAFDGDGDRVAFLDETGKYINSAAIAALITDRLLKKEPRAKIVYTNLTSRVFEETIKAGKGKPVIARVGHAFIETMRKHAKALFGAEHSGHFYYRDYFYTDSVALTLLHVLDAYGESRRAGHTFSQMMKPYLRYYQNEDVIVEVRNREAAMAKTEAFLLGLKPTSVKHFDGVAVDYGEVWGSVKISVTEYALKMMFESIHKSAAQELQRKVVKYVQSIAHD